MKRERNEILKEMRINCRENQRLNETKQLLYAGYDVKGYSIYNKNMIGGRLKIVRQDK